MSKDSSSLLGKLKRLDTSFEFVSQYSGTTEGMEDKLGEPDTIVMTTKDELFQSFDHILKRIARSGDTSQTMRIAKDNIAAMRIRFEITSVFEAHVVSIEYLVNFVTSKTYTVIVRTREGSTVLSMIHVSLQ